METLKNLPIHEFAQYEDWLNWLAESFTRTGSIWLKFAKKGSGATTLSYEEAREGALRYGWIDGQRQKYDEKFYLLMFTPRRPKSIWSKVNCTLAEELIERQLMFPSGLAQVEAAKRDGRWDAAYAPASSMAVPDDFQAALAKHPVAEEKFNQLSKANRYSFLFRLHTAKREATRQTRITQYIEMLAAGETLH